MKIFVDFASYLQSLNKKDFERYLAIFLITVTILVLLINYYIYSKSSNLLDKIKNMETTVRKTTKIIQEYEELESKEQELQKLLEQNRDFSIKAFFEEFCSQNQILPVPGWEAITQPLLGSDRFDEVVISATFKNQTTQKLVNILDLLEKTEMVYIKELVIKKTDNKKIDFDLTIATKKYVG
ncbi:hypothetical protein GF322_03485 [Candidatus Dependentiae bacterium]|nr:hypothetical protein [Candidatus Dependentiae bacterium]